MLAFVIRRLLQSALVMAVVAFIAFGLFNFTGDPVQFMVGQDTTLEERAKLRADLGLDRPFYVQFVKYLGNAVQGITCRDEHLQIASGEWCGRHSALKCCKVLGRTRRGAAAHRDPSGQQFRQVRRSGS